MKIKELIAILDNVNPEAEVIFKLNSDTYTEDGFEIFEILKSVQSSGDETVHIVFED